MRCFQRILPGALVLLACMAPAGVLAEEPFDAMSIRSAKTAAELLAAAERLDNVSGEAVKNKTFTYALQDKILGAATECSDQAVALHGRNALGPEPTARAFFAKNRDVLRRIIDLNRKTLDDYQETLDEMENPLAFFKTPAWREPERLAALASFRLGWNDYYAGLLFSEGDPNGTMFFGEAVESFTRALVDCKEDRLIVTSVFGRGLCYKRLKAYKDALKDFQAVRAAAKKEDTIYARCLYEETHIALLEGDRDRALRGLDEIERRYPDDRIPDALKASLKELRASMMQTIAGQGTDKDRSSSEQSRKNP